MLPSRSRLSVLVFLLPPLVLYAVAVLGPILQSLYLSFFSWDGITAMEFVGLDNYRHMLTQDSIFWEAFRNALVYLAVCLFFQLGVGVYPEAQEALDEAGDWLARRLDVTRT